MRKVLRIRNARLFLFGDVVSTLGDSALWLAMAIWLKEMTHSSAAAGLVIFAYIAGSLFSPLGGVLADRFRRRPLLIWSNLIAAALVLLIVLVHHRSQIWLVYLVIFLYGVIGSAIGPAQTALLPALVPEDLLAEANGAQQTLNEGMRLIVPLLGAGLFVLVGGGAVAEIDAGTFLVAVVSLVALRVDEPGPAGQAAMARGAAGQVSRAENDLATPAGDGAGVGGAGAPAGDGQGASGGGGVGAPVEDGRSASGGGGAGAPAEDGQGATGGGGRISAGFLFIGREPVLRAIMLALGLSMLVIGFTESAIFSVVTVGLHHSASFVGVTMTVQGVGAVAGGLTAPAILRRMPEGMLTAMALACVVGAVLLLTLPNVVPVLAGMVVAGFAGPWLIVAATTAIQRRTPSPLLGRVSGAFNLGVTVPQVASVALGAALIAVLNYRILLVTIAVVVAVATLFLVTRPETRLRTVEVAVADADVTGTTVVGATQASVADATETAVADATGAAVADATETAG
jgi:MFS family permease